MGDPLGRTTAAEVALEKILLTSFGQRKRRGTVAVPNDALGLGSRRASNSSPVALMFAVFAALTGVAGCSSNAGAPRSGESDGSIFEKASIPVRAVVVTRGQKPYPLESLEIRASPASVVAPLLKAAKREHEQRVTSKLKEIDRTRGLLSEENQRLDQKKQEVSDGYNGKIPKQADLPPESSRDDLDVLTKMRAQKSRAVQSFEAALEVTIRPIESEVRRLEGECYRLEAELRELRQSFNTIIFESLPVVPAKKWITDANGYATVSVARSEPWYFWSETSRDVPGSGTENYRWILTHPDDLDDAGKLFLDHRNLLDSRSLVVDADTGLLGTTPIIDRRGY